MSAKRQTSKEPEDKFVVRFPCGMRERIAIQAKSNERSMNSEILHRLDRVDELETEIQRANQVIDRLLAQQPAGSEPANDARGH
ncbi:DNA-binding protein [Pseudomonas sp. RW407]|uniref:Arc family DNA-binding protein n=1 Tax=Pseudomonas sp. RW407 TaxID=2202894 RepID=UPI000D6F6AD8|nr:Arc family DNA-binding protein [Pseudomonas sp. RW407]PWU27329.1 DNA-binding protein [Pseudomonas sp. RW407]